MLKALYFPNFRLFYGGFLFSNIGNMMQTVAVSWLVYRLTDSPMMVGVLFFIKQLLMFVMSPVAGYLADRFKRVNILLCTSLLSGFLGVGLGVFTLTGYVTILLIMIYQFFDGIFMGVDMTVRQAFLKDMVRGKTFVTNAIALNSLLFNIARIFGPMAAGFIIGFADHSLGEGYCFLINGITFFVVSSSLLLMKNLRNETYPSSQTHFAKNINEGLQYTLRHEQIRNIIILAAAIGFFGFPITVLLPDFCKITLGGGSDELSLLTTIIGVGAVFGGVFLASRRQFETFQKLILFAPYLYGGGIVAMAYADQLYIAIVAVFCVGLGQSLIFSSCNSIIQTMCSKALVGRVLSLYIMLFMGATTVGSLLSGNVAQWIGTPATFIISGLGCVLSVFVYNINMHREKESALRTSRC